MHTFEDWQHREGMDEGGTGIGRSGMGVRSFSDHPPCPSLSQQLADRRCFRLSATGICRLWPRIVSEARSALALEPRVLRCFNRKLWRSTDAKKVMCEHAAVPSSSDIGKVRTKEGPPAGLDPHLMSAWRVRRSAAAAADRDVRRIHCHANEAAGSRRSTSGGIGGGSLTVSLPCAIACSSHV